MIGISALMMGGRPQAPYRNARYGYARIAVDIKSPIEILSRRNADSRASGVRKRTVVVEDANLPYNEIRIVVGPSQIERLAQPTGPTTQSPIWSFGIPSIGSHHFNPGERLQCSDEDAGSDAHRLTHHIGQVVDPVRQVHLEVSRRTEQRNVTFSDSPEAAACWFALVICFHLYDTTAQRSIREDLSDETPGNQLSGSLVELASKRLRLSHHHSPLTTSCCTRPGSASRSERARSPNAYVPMASGMLRTRRSCRRSSSRHFVRRSHSRWRY